MARVAIIGGGIAGATAALTLGRLGLDVTLFEKGKSLVSGPPFCHLHAGGNLYREISDEQCVTLLRQSIDLLRFYPYAVDFRPTVIAVPHTDSGAPEALYPRLRRLQDEYRRFIAEDGRNRVLGDPETYFRIYDRESVEALRTREPVKMPQTPDEWMIPVAREVDLSTVKFPLIMVQEYGLNLFRLGAGATLSLQGLTNCDLLLETTVTAAQRTEDGSGFLITAASGGESETQRFDYLVNAAGFRTGEIDDMLGYRRERMVEFKAAYVTQWKEATVWPEVIFHGERGTPNGMAQFTPYPCGLIQLHGMTNDITLFDEGLVGSTPSSAQPNLDERFIEMIDREWEWSCVEKRSRRAIEHMARYIPAFINAEVASKPLFGAQQIPGDDPTLRAADVSFVGERYARCEVVKASSVLSMSDAIAAQLAALGYVAPPVHGIRRFQERPAPSESQIQSEASSICEARSYPSCLSRRTVRGDIPAG
ncbi:FAD-dependent oxidoreductase [Sulfurimonas sp. HSL-1656]|uniref:FAD-dependent oxidoreductase n=1 Tax=Thiomicrolovo subterrani TaxID=3131934 RepID=UPI0031F99BE4